MLALGGVILLGIVLILIIDSTGGRPAAPAPTATAAATATASATPDAEAASRAARAFLDGFLPFLYGRGGLDAVTGVDPTVRPGLAADRQEISAAERMRAVAVHDIQVQPQPGGGVSVVALIQEGDPAAGASTYPLRFQMRLVGGSWTVITVPTLG